MSGAAEVTFIPTREDTIAAYRLHHRLDRKQIALTSLTMVSLGLCLFGMSDRSMVNFANAVATVVVSLGVAFVVLWFVVLPWRVGRLYAQQRNLHEEVVLAWDGAGLRVRAPSGRTQMAWGDYSKRRENNRVILLYQSEALFQFIPRHVLSTEQAGSLEACMAGISVRR